METSPATSLQGEGTQRQFQGAGHLRFGGAVGGLDSQAGHDDRNIAGEIFWIDVGSEVALFTCPLHAIFYRRLTAPAPFDQRLFYRLGTGTTGQASLKKETASGVGGIGQQGERTAQQVLDHGAGGRLPQGFVDVRRWAFGVVSNSLFEKLFLVAEAGVDAGAVDAHGLG